MSSPMGLVPGSWDPSADDNAVLDVARAARALGAGVHVDHPLGARTTLGVGGPARCFIEAPGPTELAGVLTSVAAHAEAAVPMLVLGRGSNLLVGDFGWPGVVVQLGAGFKWQRRDGDEVRAGGGLAMPALAAWSATEGLAGLEFAAGIPASVGGSVRMNAGAHHGSTADLLVDVDVATTDATDGRAVDPRRLGFGYRCSTLPPRSVVVAARWRLRPDDPEVIRGRLDEMRAYRRQTQPLRQRNCGSVFTNPEGDSAGRLLESAGLKGLRRGGAQVSDKHANFIVVDPAARAADVRGLIAELRRAVLAAGGPLLEPEVRLVGRFEAPPS
ncbi:MAG TPA: UDP-N-acetylmuramate dehydrogenase [Mycobacteriales bacterium]|nr:UDP-N-acetylmuramate dehydrogenase [Mycobacteriales bacterium]